MRRLVCAVAFMATGCVTTSVGTTVPTTSMSATSTVVTTTTTTVATTAPSTISTTATTVPLLTIGDWEPIPAAPVGRAFYLSVWTGREVLILGNPYGPEDTRATGEAYDPAGRTWRMIASAPQERDLPASVWTGSEWLIWSGEASDGNCPTDGFSYDPAIDSWTAIPSAPIAGRLGMFTVWTGTELIVWGGSFRNPVGGPFNDGAAYDPATKKWRVLADAPLGHKNAGVAAWTGSRMIVGGTWDSTDGDPGWASYDPATDTWSPISSPPDMDARFVSGGVWTGSQTIFAPFERDGTRLWLYEPETDEWTRSTSVRGDSLVGVPVVWTGSRVVFYGSSGSEYGSGAV
jgi:hypothetical protein